MNDVKGELAILGRDLGGPRWVQGPGGNVSVKHEGKLFVKASGTLLRDVGAEGGHVGVSMEDALRALEGDAEADARVFGQKPRPSLETYFHALEGRVVAHTHAVEALLVACAGESLLHFDARVPYQRPGRDLALAIRDARRGSDVVLLESHGVLVFAETADAAVTRSREIVARCLEAAKVDAARFDAMFEASLACDPGAPIDGGVVRRVPDRPSADRYLFPDAVVFVSVVRGRREDAARLLAVHKRAFVIADGDTRHVVAKTAAAAQSAVEVLAAHDFVADALGARARWLPDDEPHKILGLPSEQYRIANA